MFPEMPILGRFFGGVSRENVLRRYCDGIAMVLGWCCSHVHHYPSPMNRPHPKCATHSTTARCETSPVLDRFTATFREVHPDTAPGARTSCPLWASNVPGSTRVAKRRPKRTRCPRAGPSAVTAGAVSGCAPFRRTKRGATQGHSLPQPEGGPEGKGNAQPTAAADISALACRHPRIGIGFRGHD